MMSLVVIIHSSLDHIVSSGLFTLRMALRAGTVSPSFKGVAAAPQLLCRADGHTHDRRVLYHAYLTQYGYCFSFVAAPKSNTATIHCHSQCIYHRCTNESNEG